MSRQKKVGEMFCVCNKKNDVFVAKKSTGWKKAFEKYFCLSENLVYRFMICPRGAQKNNYAQEKHVFTRFHENKKKRNWV